MSAPKKWALQSGEVSDVHTPFTTRARELLDLHNGLRMKDLTVDERLDVLLHVKWTVKEFDCNLTRELVSLIDREADMLNRGRNERSLQGLRQRIANLFLQFEETPEFNPEAARFQRVRNYDSLGCCVCGGGRLTVSWVGWLLWFDRCHVSCCNGRSCSPFRRVAPCGHSR